jgi:hypothetical protein
VWAVWVAAVVRVQSRRGTLFSKRGTESSNPPPPSEESYANLTAIGGGVDAGGFYSPKSKVCRSLRDSIDGSTAPGSGSGRCTASEDLRAHSPGGPVTLPAASRMRTRLIHLRAYASNIRPDALAAVGRLWRDLLAVHIDRAAISLVIDLGCGTGHFSELLAAHFGVQVGGEVCCRGAVLGPAPPGKSTGL